MQALAHVVTLARLATLAAVLALIGLLGIRPSVDDGAGARAMGPLPPCRYDDILTTPRSYERWSVTLVDTILRVPRTYAPPDLVRVADLGVPGKGQLRAVMAEDLKAMSDAAAGAGSPIGIHSAYRSYATQVAVFDNWVNVHGYNRALQLSARPGHSEHQLGLAIDVRSDPPVSTLQGSWGATPAGKWMRNHAWEYGFVMSYPKGKMAIVCYDYEPWHFRYVGRELAAEIRASGLTLREYLWKNYTTTVVPKVTPKPTTNATPRATGTAARTQAPSATVTPSPSPTASPNATVAPTAGAVPAATPFPTSAPTAVAPPAPTATAIPIVGDGDVVLHSGPVWIAAAALALGTIVLGGALLVRRRGRAGVGL